MASGHLEDPENTPGTISEKTSISEKLRRSVSMR